MSSDESDSTDDDECFETAKNYESVAHQKFEERKPSGQAKPIRQASSRGPPVRQATCTDVRRGPVAGHLKPIPGCVSVDTRNVAQYSVGMFVKGMAQGRVTGVVKKIYTQNGRADGPGTLVIRLGPNPQMSTNGNGGDMIPKQISVVAVSKVVSSLHHSLNCMCAQLDYFMGHVPARECINSRFYRVIMCVCVCFETTHMAGDETWHYTGRGASCQRGQ